MSKSIPNNIVDLDLSVTSKKKFRFNGDGARIVEVDTADFNITGRFKIAYEKLIESTKKAEKILEGVQETEDAVEGITTFSERLKEIDTEMRELIDFLFDAPVSAAAAPSGSMYDIFDGDFRYNHIISLMIDQYAENIQSETKKMSNEIKKHTDSYKKRKK